ncbi:MAG: 3'-5' exonuclease [Chloroflexota bacterium]
MKWSTLSFIAFDLETTGTHPAEDRVLQFGAVLCRVEDGSIVEEASLGMLCGSPVEPHPGAVKAHGITAARVAGLPAFEDRLPEVVAFLRRADLHVAYNAGFDLAFLRAGLRRIRCEDRPVARCIDPMVFARASISRRGLRRGWRLEEVAGLVEVPLPGAHDALCDARATAEVLVRLAGRMKLPEDLDALLALQAKLDDGWYAENRWAKRTR